MTSSDKYSRKNNNGFCVAKHFIYIFFYIFLNLILCHLIFILHIIYFYFSLLVYVCVSIPDTQSPQSNWQHGVNHQWLG